TDDRERALNNAAQRLQNAARNHVAQHEHSLDILGAALEAGDPLMPLSRGYALVSVGGSLVRSVETTPPGTEIEVRLTDGSLAAVVGSVHRPGRGKRKKI
ncbi:exodeoxyribonuclease VII large subunit, partial [Desulfovibrio sp. 1188_IL3213]|uniref:exodeoxyribonuclease VII large subunit n=1 Tax=Desulfovibrio sp. 1188_IL3213 TaxID=3084052 RepID=UPI002FD9941E